MRRLLTTSAALAVLAGVATSEAEAQTPLVNLGIDYTPAFVGDDFEPLEGGIGFHGGVLFPLGPLSHIGADLSWTGIGFEGDVSDEVDASILDVQGIVNVGLGSGEGARPYVDIRAGYSRMSFDIPGDDGSISGPTAGGGLGVRVYRGAIAIDAHGLYQHHWYGEKEGLVFETDASGGRVILGAGVSIPFGGN